MTAKQKNNIPKLRFPEFSDLWKVQKLDDACKINPGNGILPEEFIYIDLESVNNGVLEKEQVVQLKDAPSRAQRVLDNNDILYQTVRPYQRNNLFFNKGNGYVASTGYAQLRANGDPRYLYQYLHTSIFVNKVLLRCTGTGYPAINSTDLSSIMISTPSLPEQQKIASFLTAIDDKIQQLTRKQQLLEQYKKSVMQKILSREIRFRDDNGKIYPRWEEKRFGDITYKISDKNVSAKKYPVYSINNIKGFVPQSEQFEGVDSNGRGYDISMYKIIGKNTFAYNPARINVGSLGYSDNLEKIMISSLYVCFKTKENINDRFILSYLKSNMFNRSVLRTTEGGVRSYLFYDNFAQIKIKIPVYNEQKKISNYLIAIDKKIEIANQQLDKMKEFKKGLLQQMFV